MNKSENLNELFTALSKAQGEMDNIGKSKEGYGYKYAELGACIEAVKPILAANGLSVMQMLGKDEQGNNLTTMLCHSSGQYMGETCHLPSAVLSGNAGKNPVQCMGASITYVRRYAYASILGLAQVDEDAANMVASKKAAAKMPESISKAIKTNDAQWVMDNWQGEVASAWGSLTPTVQQKLNV
jgi:hypothetical protein